MSELTSSVDLYLKSHSHVGEDGNTYDGFCFTLPKRWITETVGFKPYIPDDGTKRYNAFGDKACKHVNVKGNICVDTLVLKGCKTHSGALLDGSEQGSYFFRSLELSGKNYRVVQGDIDTGIFVYVRGSRTYQSRIVVKDVNDGDPDRHVFYVATRSSNTTLRADAHIVWQRWRASLEADDWYITGVSFNTSGVSPTVPISDVVPSPAQQSKIYDRVTATYDNGFSDGRFLNNTERGVSSVELSITPKSIKEVKTRIWQIIERLNACVETPDGRLNEFGWLSESIAEGTKRVQSNMLTTLIELATTPTQISSFAEMAEEIGRWVETFSSVGASNLRSYKNFLTSLTNLRLSLKWGTPLTVKDMKEFLLTAEDAFLADCEQRSYSKGHASLNSSVLAKSLMKGLPVRVTRFLTVYYDEKDSREIDAVRWLFDWNFLSLENLWDMIPYSFIVDWFIQLGDKIRVVDNQLYRMAFQEMLGSIQTTVTHLPVTSRHAEMLCGFSFHGDLSVKLYHRSLSRLVPLPQFSRGTPTVGGTQYLDGTSLVLQRV